jgi:thioredoxin-related protein
MTKFGLCSFTQNGNYLSLSILILKNHTYGRCAQAKKIIDQYKKAATIMKGFVNFGAVECDENEELSEKYDIQGFPTFKIFTGNNWTVYDGKRKTEDFIEAALTVKIRSQYE